MLASWNAVETSYPTHIEQPSQYDEEAVTEYNQALVVNNKITLGIKNYQDLTSDIKGAPSMSGECSEKTVPVFYGKAWGVYVPGDESGEDGIRAENNDGSLIVDGKDTFWEVESVVLQEDREETTYLQNIVNKDVSLTATAKVIFNAPVYMNSFTVSPYNAAVNAYYKLIEVKLSDGQLVVPLSIPETTIMRETSFVFNVPTVLATNGIRSVIFKFRQDTGYNMKYSLGYFRIKNNESWLDITGSHVTEMAKKMGGNFNDNISSVINNSGNWILNYWMPGVVFSDKVELVKNMGTDGLLLIPSSESRRKRYCIGITDVIMRKNEYYDQSELVTKSIDIPTGAAAVSLLANDMGKVTYYISFDDGISWNRILPIGKENQRRADLRLVPKTLYINSDLSFERRQNSDTGTDGYIYTASKAVRVRFVLETENNLIPEVNKWELIWS